MNRIFNIIFFFFLSFCGSAQAYGSVSADSIVAFSKKYMGIKYCYARSTPKSGFDCSGFVYYVFNHFNIDVPRASMDYEKMGKIISPDSSRPGDIIVFTGTNARNRHPGHVGIVLSEAGQGLSFIHSSSSKKKSGVKISTYLDSPGYKERFIKIVRLDNSYITQK